MSGIALGPSFSSRARACSLVRPDTAVSWVGLMTCLLDAGATKLVELTIDHPYRSSRYHHSIARCEWLFECVSGLTEWRSRSGHCTSLTTFSAIEPKTRGCQPEMP